jgi:hypothetical protein
MIISFLAPGVGSSLIINGLSRKSTPSTQLSSSFCESSLEAFCLAGLASGVASGKSLIALEIGLVGFSSYFIPLFLGLILLSWILLPIVTNIFRGIAQLPGINLFSCGVSVMSCFVLAGIPGILICFLGLCTVMFLQALRVPSNVLSLAFLSPVLL